MSSGGGDTGGGGGGGDDKGGGGSTNSGGFIPSDSGSGGNLSGSGPVGGDSGLPGAGGGTNTFGGFDSFVSPNVSSFGSDPTTSGGGFAGPTAETAASSAAPAGSGGSALGFAAPTGIEGSPQLDNFIADPSGAATPPVPTSPDSGGVLDSLLPAQKATVDSYVANQPTLDPSSSLPGATSSGSSSSSSGSNSGGLSDLLGKPNLGLVVAGGGLLNNLINGNKPVPQSANLNAAAGSAAAVAAQQNAAGVALQQYVTTGTLPQGYEDQVQQAAQAAKQQIISNYANRGLPTDPTKNSTLQQELAQVDAKLPAMREQLAGQLATQGGSMVNAGLQATGISAGVFNDLANLETAQNTARATAIANFAASLNGGTKPNSINLNLGGTKAA